MTLRIGGQITIPGDELARPIPLTTPEAPSEMPVGEPAVAAVPEESSVDAFTDADEGLSSRVTGVFREAFGTLAASAIEFHGFIETVFGDGYDRDAAEGVRVRSSEGDFRWLPPIDFLESETLHNANGAYDAEDEVVFLNDNLRQNIPLAAETFVEEVGHYLDFKLNDEDSVGDEGELFRRLLLGEKLSDSQIDAIRREDDSGTITVGGRTRLVEFRAAKAVYTRLRHYGDRIRLVVKWVFDPKKDAIVRSRKRRRILERLINAMQLAALRARVRGSRPPAASKRPE